MRHAEGHLLPLARDTPRHVRASEDASLPLLLAREIVMLAPRTRDVRGSAWKTQPEFLGADNY